MNSPEADRARDRDEIARVPSVRAPRVREKYRAGEHDEEAGEVPRRKRLAAYEELQRRDEDREKVGQKGRSRGGRELQPDRLQDVASGEHDAEHRADSRVPPPGASGERQHRGEDRERSEEADRDDEHGRHVVEARARCHERPAPDDRRDDEKRFGCETGGARHGRKLPQWSVGENPRALPACTARFQLKKPRRRHTLSRGS